MTNYIYEYYQKIKDGSIVAGEYIKTIYSYLIEGLENKEFVFDVKKADRAIMFIENFCRHHEGALAPNLIKLELWQKALISAIFGILDNEGNRQFREILIVIARKNGKTLLAAAISAYCAYLDGEYGGRIYFTAPKLQQASLCFNAFHQMITKEPELSVLAKKRRTDIYLEKSNTSAMPLAFSAKKSDGLNVSLAIADEVASWEGDGGLKFYEVIKSSLGARKQPLIVSISTAGYINNGVYDELMLRASRVLRGESKERRFLPILYIIDDIEKWNDINELQKSNPNLGVSVSVDYLIEEIAIAENSLSKKAEFLTKYCNIKQNSSCAWLATKTIKKMECDELRLEDFRGSYCVGGIDLSQTTDLTAASVIIERNGIEYVLTKAWLPREKLEEAMARDRLPYDQFVKKGWLGLSGENFIDYKDVYEWFMSLVNDYEIYPLVVGYDRYSSQYLVSDMKASGFLMDDVYQGHQLYPILMQFEGMAKDGRIKIGNNDLFKIHLLDGAIKMDVQAGRGRLVKVSPNAHIDIVASVIDGLTVKSKYHDQYGEQLKNN